MASTNFQATTFELYCFFNFYRFIKINTLQTFNYSYLFRITILHYLFNVWIICITDIYLYENSRRNSIEIWFVPKIMIIFSHVLFIYLNLIINVQTRIKIFKKVSKKY